MENNQNNNPLPNMGNSMNNNTKNSITPRMVLKALTLVCLILVFCPAFLVSCSGSEVNISTVNVLTGVSIGGMKVTDPEPAMILFFAVPIVMLVIAFINAIKNRVRVVVLMSISLADIVIWQIFRAMVKKEAIDNYCSFRITSWFILDMIVMFAIALLSFLILIGKLELDSSLAKLSGSTAATSNLAMENVPVAPATPSTKSGSEQKVQTLQYCPNCGMKLAPGSVFCAECGHQVSASVELAASQQPVTPQQPAMEQKPAMPQQPQSPQYQAHPLEAQPSLLAKFKEKKLVVAIVAAAVVLLLVISIIFCVNRNTINMDKYVTITTSGYNGYGTVTATIDWDAIQKKYGKRLKYQKGKTTDFDGLEALYSPMDALSDTVSVKLDETSYLSNGDAIKYTWDLDDANTFLNLKIKGKGGTYKVSGLKKVDTFDAFKDVTVSFEGVAPQGEATLTYNGDELSEYDFVFDKSSGLSNGDTVTVSVNENTINTYIDEHGKAPKESSKTYKVKGLDSYITKLKQIDTNALADMQKQATDVFNAKAAQDWSSDEEMLDSMNYLGEYLLTAKSDDPWGEQNQLFLVYKASIRDTYASDEGAYDQVNDVFWYICFENLMVDDGGKVTVDVTDYNTPEYISNVQFDTGISDGWFGTRIFTYDGYESLADLKKDVVTAQKDVYKSEEHVDESGMETQEKDDSNVAMDAEGYIIADSDKRVLTTADLDKLSAEECKLARNEIYARHGRKFKDEAVQKYFDGCSWYHGTIEADDFQENMLSDIENQNKTIISNYETDKGYK